MEDFKNIKFKWTFRKYQQAVLDELDEHLKDQKINIVAAPGSGKTILGLELIKRLGKPCLVFSPTTTIRDQWGERFVDAFLPEGEKEMDYISYDLNNVKLVTSVTYQALYSAMEKIEVKTEDEEVDYSKVDMFKLIKEYGIGTICLDEAHHLQNEWQKILEKFISAIDKNLKVISLTATPPYDASKQEWERYISTCGQIDDEIFVPELVKDKTLCPHQDFVYFNNPTAEELQLFKDYRKKAFEASEKAKELEIFAEIPEMVERYTFNESEFLFEWTDEILSVFSVLKHYGIDFNFKNFKRIVGDSTIPEYSIAVAEKAFQFIVSNEDFLLKDDREILKSFLKEFGLVEKGKVALDLNEELKKMIISSTGKLESIKKIAICESDSLKDKLKMLILTDFIKKEKVVDIGKNEKLTNISVVSIFETLRRCKENFKLGCLSGSLVILPTDISNQIEKCFDLKKGDYKIKEIENTTYSIFDFKCSNKVKVSIVSKLFEDGFISILIGTKSLLGEGWDSPCINSLILSSFVGSFMLSNQMRGRAIRVYKKNPEKVSNIWHLVTIEPEYLLTIDENSQNVKENSEIMTDKIQSSDYKTLKRRFNCFVGPNYSADIIESGINRITPIKAPFSAKKFEEINLEMEQIAKNRDLTRDKWEKSLESKKSQLVLQMEVPKALKMPGAVGFKRSIKKISKCILKTFMKIGKISKKTKLKCNNNEAKDGINVYLLNATVREQNLFGDAIKEFLGRIDDPRYLIIKKRFEKFYKCKISFSCPKEIAENKKTVQIMADYLYKYLGDFDLVYTRNEAGKNLLERCKRQSFVMNKEDEVESSQKVVYK